MAEEGERMGGEEEAGEDSAGCLLIFPFYLLSRTFRRGGAEGDEATLRRFLAAFPR